MTCLRPYAYLAGDLMLILLETLCLSCWRHYAYLAGDIMLILLETLVYLAGHLMLILLDTLSLSCWRPYAYLAGDIMLILLETLLIMYYIFTNVYITYGLNSTILFYFHVIFCFECPLRPTIKPHTFEVRDVTGQMFQVS